MSVDERLFEAAKQGDVGTLTALLDRHPDKLLARNEPYQHTLLHVAAFAGHLDAVDLLLRRGLDVNAREKGDNTYAMHWAAAAGHLNVVRRLADAGGDVVGHGDDHELEVIGWATSWEGCDDAAHGALADFLVSRGARHHIFSAVALSLAGVVRRIVAGDPRTLSRRMSRNENNQLPLHFAVRMKRPGMVALLVELGADPLAVDASGYPAAMYATSTAIDRPAMEAIHAMTRAELVSAARGARAPRPAGMDLVAALSVGDHQTAERLLAADSGALAQAGPASPLPLMAKRGDVAAVRWLLARGADPNLRWAHWDSGVTPLHLAVLGGHREVVELLVNAGADPQIEDTRHESDALGWAEFFQHPEIVSYLTTLRAR